MKFEWDEKKAAANQAKHGVRFALAAAVFSDAARKEWPVSFHQGDERRTLTVGRG